MLILYKFYFEIYGKRSIFRISMHSAFLRNIIEYFMNLVGLWRPTSILMSRQIHATSEYKNNN